MSAPVPALVTLHLWRVRPGAVPAALLRMGLDRGRVRLGVSGKVTSPAVARAMLAQGADFVLIGRAAILHHDFPELSRDPAFEPIALPVSRQHLVDEGLGPAFLDYMATWKGFIEEPVAAEA